MSRVSIGQQVKDWYGATIAKVATHETVRALASQWQHIRDEREPLLEDFWHKPQSGIADHAIVLQKGLKDYTYFHHGKALQEKIGFGMQGKTLSELRTPIQRRMREVFDRCTADYVPAYFQCFDEYEAAGTLWGYLCLPVRTSSDIETMSLVIYCHFIEDKPSIFRSLFDRSSSAVIVAEPIPNQFGQIENAWIVSRNERGDRYCRNAATDSYEVLLRGTHLFSIPNVWEAVVEAAPRGVSHIQIQPREPTKPSLQVTVEMIDERIVLRITESDHAPRMLSLD
ncbi:hypothetical protein [Methylobacterium fujisawaense]